jgi:Ca-activated chloride channel family protein
MGISFGVETQMIFANKYGLYLFFLLPFLLLLIPLYFYRIRKIRKLWGDDLLYHFSNIESRRQRFLRVSLISLSLISIMVAFARPEWGKIEGKGFDSNLDIVVLLDVSKSMNVQDIKPSRLERARMEVKALFDKAEGARFGIVTFSSAPLILCPLTDDKGALNLLFEIADTKLIPLLGTDIGIAMAESLRLFSFDDERAKVLIVISDGEDWGESAFKAAATAQTLKVRIFSVGIGTEKGGVVVDEKLKPIIDPDTGKDGYSSLDSRKLKHIADVTDGRYFEISRDTDNLNDLIDELKRIKMREYATKEGERREEQFSIFAFISFFALFAIIFLNVGKRGND